MLNADKQAGFWLESAREDWEVAGELVTKGRTRHGLFFAHLAMEKALKAHVCRSTDDTPPRTHDLLRLAELSGVAEVVRSYIATIRGAGIDVNRAIVFGSHSRGEATAESDIDLAIIAREFDPPRDRARTAILWRLRANTDARIEPFGVGVKQWEEDDTSPLIAVVRRDGHEVPLQ